MALRFLDSFDHYATADLTKKWTAVSGAIITAAQGRRSTASMSVNVFGQGLTQSFDNQATWIIGVSARYTVLPATNNAVMLAWQDVATTQVDLRVLFPSGTLQATRNGTILGTSTAMLTAGTAHYIECLVTIHASAGVVEVHVDGVNVLSLTSQNTRATANAYAQTFRLGNFGGNGSQPGTTYFDDLYICDGTGAAPHNTFLGDCRVDTLLPNADGTAQQWTPSTPGTHYTLVDDAAPNTTDYVSSATIGHRDTYGMQDLAASTGTIYGVQLSLAAHKEDAGARLLKPLILSGASEALGASVGMPTDQLYYRHIQTTDPATAAAWTESGVNAAQCGAEVA